MAGLMVLSIVTEKALPPQPKGESARIVAGGRFCTSSVNSALAARAVVTAYGCDIVVLVST